MIVTSSRNGSSELRLVCDRSKSRPVFSGAQRYFLAPNAVLPAQPWTISMATKRSFFAAACVWPYTFPAGVIASRDGNATVTPIDLRIVRRERCFFVRKLMSVIPRLILVGYFGGDGRLGLLRLER